MALVHSVMHNGHARQTVITKLGDCCQNFLLVCRIIGAQVFSIFHVFEGCTSEEML